VKGLEQALRGILDAGGDIRKRWNLQYALAAGDRAVGGSVLQPLYAKMKDKPLSADLTTAWSQLGAQSDGTNVRCDDSVALAAIRRAITAAGPSGVEEHSFLPRPTAVILGGAVRPAMIGLAIQNATRSDVFS
jgi:hypothetical protein